MRTAAGGVGGDAEPRVTRALGRVPGIVGTWVATLGTVVLLGWALKLRLITSLHPDLAVMKANTAFGLVCLGLALKLSQQPGQQSERFTAVLAGFAGALGAATLTEHALGIELGIDQLLTSDPWTAGVPGRMSIITATHFLLLGSALLLSVKHRRGHATSALAAVVGLSSLLVLLGYAYGVRSLYAIRPYNTVALHTAFAFFALSAGILCLRPETGVMAVLSARGPGGTLARRLLPALIVIPILLGGLRVLGQRLGFYGTGFGVALLVVSNVTCLALLVLWTAVALERAHAGEQRSEARFRRMTEAGIIGIVVSDIEGNITEANDAFLATVRYSRDDLSRGLVSGRHLNTPERDRTDANARRELAALGVARPWEKELVRKDGSRVPVLNGVVALDRERKEFIAFVLDRSELQRSEEARLQALAVAQTEAQNRQRVERALLDTAEQLRQSQKMEAIGTLAGGVAHDFNNILSVILGFGELLISELDAADPMRKDLEQMTLAGRRASDLTRQLLAFSRRQVLKPRIVNLNDAISSMGKLLHRVIGEDIELTLRLADGLGTTHVDPGQMEQVLLNLVVNARDAMPRGGKLTIETGNVELDATYAAEHLGVEPGSYVVMSVSDTGTGIERAIQARIFEPFFTTKAGKGTGLGLSTVHGIVRQSGGHVWVYSELLQGSTFKIYLPRSEAGATESERVAAPSTTLRGSETILLVEDDGQVRTLAVAILRRHGYRLLDAASGGEALLLCEQHDGAIHLLLTDVVMPRMSGRELWERIAPLRPEMKVLFMSGYTDDAIVRHGVLGSEFDFVQKPLGSTALLGKVRAVLDGPICDSSR